MSKKTLRSSWSPDDDRIILRREGGKATFWLARAEIQHLWQHYRPDKPVETYGVVPVEGLKP